MKRIISSQRLSKYHHRHIDPFIKKIMRKNNVAFVEMPPLDWRGIPDARWFNNGEIKVTCEVIQTDEATVVKALLWAAGEEVAHLDGLEITGTSKRTASDAFDPQIGLELALGEALRQIGRELLHHGNYQVHERAKVREIERASVAEANARRREMAEWNRAAAATDRVLPRLVGDARIEDFIEAAHEAAATNLYPTGHATKAKTNGETTEKKKTKIK